MPNVPPEIGNFQPAPRVPFRFLAGVTFVFLHISPCRDFALFDGSLPPNGLSAVLPGSQLAFYVPLFLTLIDSQPFPFCFFPPPPQRGDLYLEVPVRLAFCGRGRIFPNFLTSQLEPINQSNLLYLFEDPPSRPKAGPSFSPCSTLVRWIPSMKPSPGVSHRTTWLSRRVSRQSMPWTKLPGPTSWTPSAPTLSLLHREKISSDAGDFPVVFSLFRFGISPLNPEEGISGGSRFLGIPEARQPSRAFPHFSFFLLPFSFFSLLRGPPSPISCCQHETQSSRQAWLAPKRLTLLSFPLCLLKAAVCPILICFALLISIPPVNLFPMWFSFFFFPDLTRPLPRFFLFFFRRIP